MYIHRSSAVLLSSCLYGCAAACLFAPGYFDEVNADAPVVGQTIAAIHARSPNAKILVIGYPDILPQSGRCYPQLFLTTGDVAYLDQVEFALNAMLQQQAATHGATYVDTFTASIGHDACKAEGARWIEPLIPGTNAFPIHPNARGEAADARAVLAALSGGG